MPLQTYSQGMAMRLAFAVTTHFSNQILVMDEWIGAGDAQFSEEIVDRTSGFVKLPRRSWWWLRTASACSAAGDEGVVAGHGRIHRSAPRMPSSTIRGIDHADLGPPGLMAVLNRREDSGSRKGTRRRRHWRGTCHCREKSPLQLFVERTVARTQLVANGRGRGYWR